MDEQSGAGTRRENQSSSGTGNQSQGSSGGLQDVGFDAIIKLVQTVGLREDLWRGYLGDAIAKRLKDTDLKDATARLKDLAGASGDKLKAASMRNPAMFYGGGAAVVVGAGLLARSLTGEGLDSEMDITQVDETDTVDRERRALEGTGESFPPPNPSGQR